jgi:hypothetical protein
MKSRILQKINRNGLLGLIALSTFAFASCSRSLTSLQNSKKMQNQEVLVNPAASHEKQIAAVPQVESPAIEIAPRVDGKSLPTESSKPIVSDRLAKRHSSFASKLAPVKNQVLSLVKTQSAAINKITKTVGATTAHKQTKDLMEGGMIRRAIICFIIALIFYLIGFLVFWPLSEVFYIIATVFFVIGVIYLLFGLLRAM